MKKSSRYLVLKRGSSKAAIQVIQLAVKAVAKLGVVLDARLLDLAS